MKIHTFLLCYSLFYNICNAETMDYIATIDNNGNINRSLHNVVIFLFKRKIADSITVYAELGVMTFTTSRILFSGEMALLKEIAYLEDLEYNDVYDVDF
jgi:hypothetical protein